MEPESSNRPQEAVGWAYLIAPQSQMGRLGLRPRGGERYVKSPQERDGLFSTIVVVIVIAIAILLCCFRISFAREESPPSELPVLRSREE